MELSGSEQEGPGERVQARDSGDRGFLKELDRENGAAGVSGRAAGGWEQETERPVAGGRRERKQALRERSKREEVRGRSQQGEREEI